MKRIGIASMMIMLALVMVYGCKQQSTEAQVTGIELQFSGCLTFEAWLWVDGEFQGSYTSEQPSTIPVAAGARSLYIRSNMFVTGDTMYCWDEQVTVEDGKVTAVTLPCAGHKCVSQGGGL